MRGLSFFSDNRGNYIYKQTRLIMIYIQSTTIEQRLFVPSNGRKAQGAVTFKLYNTTERRVECSADVEVKEAGASYLMLTLPEGSETPTAGEYEYRLIDDVGFLAVGVAKVVAPTAQADEYEQIKIYKQYGRKE